MGTMATQLRQFILVGFRFQPTEMEIVDHFLKRRHLGMDFSTSVPDFNGTTLKQDPWILAHMFEDELKHQGNDKDWWFFTSRIRNQDAVRQTDSGRWMDTCKSKQITGKQTMGKMTTFVFHRRWTQGNGRVGYTRYATWKLYEYRLTDDWLDGFPFMDEERVYVLCHLKRDDEAKINADVQVPQTNGDSLTRRKKRAMEAAVVPVNQDSIFPSIEQQMHPQDCFVSPYQPRSMGFFENVQRPVESFGSDSSALELSWGSSSNRSGSSGCVDFTRDILSNSPVDHNALVEQLTLEMLLGVGDASGFHGVPPLESLTYQDGPSGETASSIQQNTNLLRNQRAQSAKSLSGVVPAEEKKILAGPQISSPRSPPAARSSVIVTEPRDYKESNYPSSSAESFRKVEARVIKEPTAANPERKKNSIVKIEEDEKLALETIEKLRLKTGSITQNQNTLPFPPSTYLLNLVVGLVVAYAICWQMLHL